MADVTASANPVAVRQGARQAYQDGLHAGLAPFAAAVALAQGARSLGIAVARAVQAARAMAPRSHFARRPPAEPVLFAVASTSAPTHSCAGSIPPTDSTT